MITSAGRAARLALRVFVGVTCLLCTAGFDVPNSPDAPYPLYDDNMNMIPDSAEVARFTFAYDSWPLTKNYKVRRRPGKTEGSRLRLHLYPEPDRGYFKAFLKCPPGVNGLTLQVVFEVLSPDRTLLDTIRVANRFEDLVTALPGKVYATHGLSVVRVSTPTDSVFAVVKRRP